MKKPHSKQKSSSLEITSLSAISHVVENRPRRIERLMLYSDTGRLNSRQEEIWQLASDQNIRVEIGPKPRNGDLSKAYLSPYVYSDVEDILRATKSKPRSIILALDHLQDPQNFGALCRTAEGLGVDGLLIPRDRGVTVTPGVYHASVGAVETLAVARVGNLGDALKRLKEEQYWVLGAAQGEGAKSPWTIPDFEKVVLVLGAELEGLGQRLEQLCDMTIEIPLTGKVESLNVSVAGGLLLYELWRRGKTA